MITRTLVTTLMAATLAVTASAQTLTTGGTAGTGVNAGANIGAGTGGTGSPNLNTSTGVNTGVAADVRSNMATQEGARTNTGNTTTTPAEMGSTGSMHGSTHTAADVAGAASVSDLLPRGSTSYRYYKEANVYYSPSTQTYYYTRDNRWYSGAEAPGGVTLGKSTTVRMQGTGATR